MICLFIYGDVLYFWLVVINYGGSIGIVVFYGVNDGVFYVINGNQMMGINGVCFGGELWGFILLEFIGKLSWLYVNLFQVKLFIMLSGIMLILMMCDDFFDGSMIVM